MPRLLVLLVLVCVVTNIAASEPSPVEKQIAIQNAMATAEQYLQANNAAQAVAVLEAELSKADGNKAFLAILKRAYLSEMAALMSDPTANAKRLNQVRGNLNILMGGNPLPPTSSSTQATPSAAPNTSDSSARQSPVVEKAIPEGSIPAEAASAFNKGDYEQAEKLFASLGAVKLNQNQRTAWAFCRIRIGAGKVNSLQCDSSTAIAVEKDVAEAIKLIPQHVELQKIGQQVIAVASLKANSRDGMSAQTGSSLSEIARPATTNSGDAVETASFRVLYTGSRELAETVAKTAENARREIFERWSGPPAGSWDLKCEIVVHPTAEAYARATSRSAASTGIANVRLANGRASERKIDLRADDATMVANALPRELTHIVLADLFPDKPPPKWAEEGMAVLAGTAEEASRYTNTLRRCAREGEWFGVAQLMDLKEYPADKITGFYCESVSLTQYLVRAHGEKNFTIFLRDCQRYGTAQSLKRQYGVDSPQSLEAAWKRSALEVGRAQAP
jgi:hypothetical protein